MTANDIISRVRYTVSDTDKTRWSDNRLLSLLNDALLDMSLTTRLYNAVGYVKLIKEKSVYNISSIASKIERIEYKNESLPFSTFDEMDKKVLNWQDDKSDNTKKNEPVSVVYDLKQSGEFIVYPTPNEHFNLATVYGELPDNIAPTLADDPDVGAILLSDNNALTGIITAKNADDEVKIIRYIDINNEIKANYLKIYFIAIPKKLVSINDSLNIIINRTTISALSHYVAGSAFRDNLDSQNIKLGNQELSLYDTKKQRLKDSDAYSNIDRNRHSSYSNVFNLD